ncbi:MAG: DUF368 domain-containing protein [Bacteroidota bacterium]
MKQLTFNFLKGLAMGAANVIPGVSGGTIALITGIYERLINAVKSVDGEALKLLLKLDIKGFWEKIDGTFLTAVFLGIGVSILSLARLLKVLLVDETYSIWVMAFFFGLILVSIYSVGRTVQKWNAVTILAFIIGTGAAVALALLSPANENEAIWYLMVCGVVAMCSMILPGLSGSFVLIIMGNYQLIMVNAVSDLNLGILIPVAIGAVLGLLAFSRLLSWVFEHYRDQTISLLTGFVLGSLLVIWPWKKAETTLIERAGKEAKEVVLGYEWYLPDWGSRVTLIALALIAVGGLVIWLMDRFAPADKERVS